MKSNATIISLLNISGIVSNFCKLLTSAGRTPDVNGLDGTQEPKTNKTSATHNIEILIIDYWFKTN